MSQIAGRSIFGLFFSCPPLLFTSVSVLLIAGDPNHDAQEKNQEEGSNPKHRLLNSQVVTPGLMRW